MPQKKRKISLPIFLISIVLSGGLLFSCADEECFSVFNNDMLISFVTYDTLESGIVEETIIDTVFYTIKAVGNDSVYYDSTDFASLFALPLNPAEDITTFEFEMLDSITFVTDTLENGQTVISTVYHRNPNTHTLTVSYEQRQRIISVECGVDMAFVGLEPGETTFSDTEVSIENLSRINEKANIKVTF